MKCSRDPARCEKLPYHIEQEVFGRVCSCPNVRGVRAFLDGAELDWELVLRRRWWQMEAMSLVRALRSASEPDSTWVDGAAEGFRRALARAANGVRWALPIPHYEEPVWDL